MRDTCIYTKTPTISVIDNRGLTIRILEYNRVVVEDPINEYTTINTYTNLGQFKNSMDPRLYLKYKEDTSILPNVNVKTSLRGDVLCNESVDSGNKVIFFNIEGKPVWNINATGVQARIEYDLLGREINIYEKDDNNEQYICTEKFIYGENEVNATDNNLRQHIVKVYDNIGLLETGSYSIQGNVLYEGRKLLKDIGNSKVDWSIEGNIDSLLDSKAYKTNWEYNVQGMVTSQTDAKGNITSTKYNEIGQPESNRVKLKGQLEQVVTKLIEYNALGQIKLVELGNGILEEYQYEGETNRTIRKKCSRRLYLDKIKILQDLNYDYDRVGNILSISDRMDTNHFYNNQIVSPKREYTYDSMYQLISATGREIDIRDENYMPPSLITPMPEDNSRYVNYSQVYEYDQGGNLIKLGHKGAISYTREMYIDERSNRGVLQEDRRFKSLLDIGNKFDKAGNQKYLLSEIPLKWDRRNQLSSIDTVVRGNGQNDRESYFYDVQGTRIIKQYVKRLQTITQIGRVIYLPGLELHIKKTGDIVTEILEIVTLPNLRVLHWEKGTKPEGIDNDQFRYSITDHVGSSALELDNKGQIISKEEFYAYGGTALWASRTNVEADYKTIRYSGKELDATGLYYYGNRYYMSWIGRWLNADPEGTIDGLNLYRMVRNNPINLIDPDGSAPNDLRENFDPARGDLLYGLHGPRIDAFMESGTEEKIERYLQSKGDDSYGIHYAFTIDDYNTEVMKAIWDTQDKNVKSSLTDFGSGFAFATNVSINEANIRTKIASGYQWWDKYFSTASQYKDKKFSATEIFKHISRYYDKDKHNVIVYSKEKDSIYSLFYIKRGCKLGLEMAAQSNVGEGPIVHMILDKLDMKKVTHKENNAITGSELRFAYRNDDRLNGKVKYYKNMKEVPAPWKSQDKHLWDSYQESRNRKYLGLSA